MVSKMSKENKKKPYKGTKDKKVTVKKQYLDLYYMLPECVGAKELANQLIAPDTKHVKSLTGPSYAISLK